MTTGYFSHPDCLAHDMGAGHPECPGRIHAIEDHLRAVGLDMLMLPQDVPLASNQDLAQAHDLNYVLTLDDFLQQLEATGDTRALDPDTWASPGTRAAAWRAAGAAVAATDAVIDGRLSNAFCAVRPPGHHATHNQTMGFCFFNNVAVAARHALNVRGLQRVAIVDFDVHHGNGTEDILAGDERALMVGIFQHPFYPYSGDQNPASNMVNVPVAAYTRGMDIRDIVEMMWIPRLEAFKPELIFISAGFDAHREDDMGQLGLTEQDYTWITQRIKDVARKHCQGRIVSCLEGGYVMGPLARSVEAHVRVLADI